MPIHKKFGGNLRGFICGGSPLNVETEQFFERIGIKIYQGYGLTETSPVISVNSPKNNRIGSVGKVLPTVKVKLSESNEILVKGTNLMQGYWLKPELNNEVIDNDGWFHTGDIGKLDNDGYLYITGRIKNLIVLAGGKKVLPEEVEKVLSNSQIIQEVCVLGIKSESGNKKDTEHVCAVIVPVEELKNEYKGDYKGLKVLIKKEVNKLSENLASYKRPSEIIVRLEELPKTTTKKIKRPVLKEMIENSIN